MGEVVARFRVQCDWLDDSYGHANQNMTAWLESLRIRYGNDVVVTEEEPLLQFGEGRMQLRFDPDVFGRTVTNDQLREVHRFRLTELETGLVCFVGLMEFVEEFQAQFLDGDLLSFDLHGLGWLRDGGTLTYPRGSEFGGSIEQGQQVVVTEDLIEPSDFALQGTVAGSLPTRMTTMADGRAIGVIGDQLVVIDGSVRFQGETFGADHTLSDPGTPTTRTRAVTQNGVDVILQGPNTGQSFNKSRTDNGPWPATEGIREETVSYYSMPVFEFQGTVWKVRRNQGTQHSIVRWNLPRESSTTNNVVHSIWFATSGSARYAESSWRQYHFEGRSVTLGDGALNLGSGRVNGGVAPSGLRGANELMFAAFGGLYAIDSGNLYSVTGFPGSPSLSSLGALPAAVNNPRSACYVGGRLYLLSNDGRSVWNMPGASDVAGITNIGQLPGDVAGGAFGFDSGNVYIYELTGTKRVYAVDRFTRTPYTPPPEDPDQTLARLRDDSDLEYFDETVVEPHPFEFVRAAAEGFGVTMNESVSTPLTGDLSGLVQYGPQWDIALVDTAYFGWVGALLMALREGDIASVWPSDVDPPDVRLTMDRIFAVEPFEMRINQNIVINQVRAEGWESLS